MSVTGLALPLCAALVTARALASQVLPVYDDAFITFRYARNLASGQGFVYHPGEWVLGTTAPAFGVIQAGLLALGLPLPEAVVALNIALDATLLVVAIAILVRAGRPLAGILFGLLYTVSPILTRVCVGGMESDCFVLVAVVAIGLFSARRHTAAVLLGSLAYFLRPEAVLLLVVFGLMALRSGGPRATLRLAATSLATVLPLLGLLYACYGTVIPASVVAKSQNVGVPPVELVHRLVVPDPLALAALPLALFGGWRSRRDPFFATLSLWLALYTAAYGIARPPVWSWYAAPLQVGIAMLAAVGVEELAARLAPRGRAFLDVRLRPVALLAAILSAATWVGVRIAVGESALTRNVARPLEAFSREHLDESSTILAGDIGMIGYFSNARIYDHIGLVWPEAHDFDDWTGIVAVHCPDYLFLTARRRNLERIAERGLLELYDVAASFRSEGPAGPSLEPGHYPDRWTGNYLLLRRREATATGDPRGACPPRGLPRGET